MFFSISVSCAGVCSAARWIGFKIDKEFMMFKALTYLSNIRSVVDGTARLFCGCGTVAVTDSLD